MIRESGDLPIVDKEKNSRNQGLFLNLGMENSSLFRLEFFLHLREFYKSEGGNDNDPTR
jgi:hypothetical protein